jgi:hypothetical protein
MNPLKLDDLVDIARYERERPEFRTRIIALKRRRRVQVGELVTLVFENRETVRFQIQEMMRAERIVTDDRMDEELQTYNQLVPAALQLSATLLIEITDREHLREILDRLVGMDRGGTTYLVVGDERIEGEFEGGHSTEVRVSAVHYVTFDLTANQAAGIAPGGPRVSLLVEHPNYQEEQVLSDDTRASLAEDLANA